MLQISKTVKYIIIMIIFGLGSKVLGFIREMLIADKFGSSMETDTFFIVITAIGLITTMLTQAINTIMVPILSEVETIEGKEKKIYHTNNLLNIVILISTFIAIIAWILSPYIIKIIASGFESKQFELAVTMMRIGLPATIFASVVGVFRGYLQSEFLFTETSASQLPFNLVYIIFLTFFSGIFGIQGLMIANMIAIASQIIIQIPSIIKRGYRYKLILNINDKYIKKIVYLIIPVLISVAINDINKIIDRSLASTLVDGSISALNYANRLNLLILGIFITAITTVIFPIISKYVSNENYEELKNTIIKVINLITIITIPATIGMIVLANPIVKLAFERGLFTSNDTQMTVGALTFYSLGLLAMAQRTFLEKVYYSIQDTKTPMINGVIAVLINIILNIIFIRFMKHKGLAFATSISATITSILLLINLKRKIGSFKMRKIIICTFKSLLASSIMGVCVNFIYNYLSNSIYGNKLIEGVILIITVLIGVLTYLLFMLIFNNEEIKWFRDIVLIKK